jgi:hypothetical protein
VRKQMMEAMDLISESPKLFAKNAANAHNPNSTTAESIDFLLAKIKALEDATMLQHNVNLQLSESVNNDDMVRKVYDSLYDQITKLDESLAVATSQNAELREKYHTDLGKMRKQQVAQQEQIAQLVGALMSPHKMKKLKAQFQHLNDASGTGDDAIEQSHIDRTISEEAALYEAKPHSGAGAGGSEESKDGGKQQRNLLSMHTVVC